MGAPWMAAMGLWEHGQGWSCLLDSVQRASAIRYSHKRALMVPSRQPWPCQAAHSRAGQIKAVMCQCQPG